MPKIKLPTKSPSVDMTPMVDLFSLLLTFFMLTTTFRPQEAAPIDMPFSVSEKIAPEKDIFTVLVSKDGKVYFNVDDGIDTLSHFKAKTLQEMAHLMGVQFKTNVNFTKEEYKKFTTLNSFGMPFDKIKTWLNSTDYKEKEALQVGVPIDSLRNELALWVYSVRIVNPTVQCCIKGDGDADIKKVKKVFDILQDKGVNKFGLITNLDAAVEVKIEK